MSSFNIAQIYEYISYLVYLSTGNLFYTSLKYSFMVKYDVKKPVFLL